MRRDFIEENQEEVIKKMLPMEDFSKHKISAILATLAATGWLVFNTGALLMFAQGLNPLRGIPILDYFVPGLVFLAAQALSSAILFYAYREIENVIRQKVK